MNKKRKICFVITSKIHYGRSVLLLQELKKHPEVELQIVVGASAILSNYGDVLPIMKKDGFIPNAKITMTLEGGSPVAMAKTTGIGLAEFATVFDNLEPDIVVVRGDRYEVMSAALAAAYLNIPLAHIEGGDVTGNIDESVRHAITKLAHIHFTTNEESQKRVITMGEHPDYVFNVGCPGVECVSQHQGVLSPELINSIGVGDVIDIDQPYIIVMQHPVTTEVGKNREHITQTLSAIYNIGIPTIWFWPNVDAGTDEISKGIRVFREQYAPDHIRFIKYLEADQFISLLKGARCLVGNSSAGIKEASYLGIPVVNIGTRQQGRMKGHHIKDVGYNKDDIKAAIIEQLNHGVYKQNDMFFKQGSSMNMAHILATISLYTQKTFFDSI